MAESIKSSPGYLYSHECERRIENRSPKSRKGNSSLYSPRGKSVTPDYFRKDPLSEEEHHTRLGKHAAVLWKHNKMTDVTVNLRGYSYPAHKTVLSCYSNYFKAKLVEKGNIDSITLDLDSVTNEAFAVLLKYMYTSELDVTCQNIGEVYTAARKLGMRDALHICVKILKGEDRREVHSVYVFTTARKLGLHDAGTRALETMCKRFEQIVGTPEFLEMTTDQVVEYLSSETLAVRSEVIVFLAALKWISVKFLEREEFCIDVISCVRFPMMTLNEILACHSPPLLPGLLEIPFIKDLMLKATCFVAAKSINEEKRFLRYSCPPRKYLLTREPIILWDPNIFDPERYAMYSEEMAACTIQSAFREYKTRKEENEAARTIQKAYRDYKGISPDSRLADIVALEESISRIGRDTDSDDLSDDEDDDLSLAEKFKKSVTNLFWGLPSPSDEDLNSRPEDAWTKKQEKKKKDKKIPGHVNKTHDFKGQKQHEGRYQNMQKDQNFVKDEDFKRQKQHEGRYPIMQKVQNFVKAPGQRQNFKRKQNAEKEHYNYMNPREDREHKGKNDDLSRSIKGLSSSIETLSGHVNKIANKLDGERKPVNDKKKTSEKKDLVREDRMNIPAKTTINPTKITAIQERIKQSIKDASKASFPSEESSFQLIFVAGGLNADNSGSDASCSSPCGWFRGSEEVEGKESYIFDPSFNEWAPAPPIPNSLHHHRLVYLNQAVYCIGGCDPETTRRGELVPLDSCYKFDLTTKSWEEICNMNHARMYHAAAVLNGKIYVVGGRDENRRVLNSVEVYDSNGDRWYELSEPLERSIMGVGMCAYNGTLLILGGMIQDDSGKQTTVDDAICYDPSKKKWIRSVEKLPFPRAFLTAIRCANKVYAIGGAIPSTQKRRDSKDDMMSVNDVHIYDNLKRQWKKATPLPNPRHYVSAATVGQSLFVLGGLTTYTSAPLTDVLLYSEGEWHACSNLPQNLCEFATTSIPKISDQQ